MIFIFCIVVAIISITLIKNIRNNNSVKQLQSQIIFLQNAVDVFYRKYDALPGDITNADLFKLSHYPSNGNGDGIVTDPINGYSIFDGEIANFWLHLGNSSFLDYQYDGATNEMARPGYSMPLAYKTDVGIFAFGSDAKNFLHIGFVQADNAKIYTKPAIAGKNAQTIDAKIDDGNPQTGKITATSIGSSDNGNCWQDNQYQTSNAFCQLKIEL